MKYFQGKAITVPKLYVEKIGDIPIPEGCTTKDLILCVFDTDQHAVIRHLNSLPPQFLIEPGELISQIGRKLQQ